MQDLLATSQVMFSFMSLLLFLNIISILGFIAAILNATCAVTKKVSTTITLLFLIQIRNHSNLFFFIIILSIINRHGTTQRHKQSRPFCVVIAGNVTNMNIIRHTCQIKSKKFAGVNCTAIAQSETSRW